MQSLDKRSIISEMMTDAAKCHRTISISLDKTYEKSLAYRSRIYHRYRENNLDV